MTHSGELFGSVILPGRTIATFILAAALVGCGAKHDDSAKKTAPQPPAVKGALLETVTSTMLPETVEVVGTVRARTSAVVSAHIPGAVGALKVREGDRVRKGQTVAQLDAQENQSLAAAAAFGADGAHRALDEAVARKKMADKTFERFHKLFNEQAVSRQEFDVKQTEKEIAAQEVARAEAYLKQAAESSRTAATMAGYTKISAPISGIVTSKQVNLGTTVFPAQPLMTIEDEGSYQLELPIPESMSARIKPGTSAQVTLDALNTTFGARITEIVPSADPASRTFIAKIPLGQKGVRSGMFGRGTISLGSSVKGMLIARKAVVEHGALTSVWVVDKDNSARMRLVKVGKIAGDRVEILSGLSDNERIVVGGAEKISEGVKVE